MPQDPAPRPKAGFSEAELKAAARVIAREVERVTARYAREPSQPPAPTAESASEPMRKSARLSP